METQTSKAKEYIEYGVLIDPAVSCRVINVRLHEELRLSPGNQYYIFWDKDDIEIISDDVATTEVMRQTSLLSTKETDSLDWLKLAEESFRFWNNEADSIWDNV